MQAIEILAEEHRTIECVLSCLEQLLQMTVKADSLDGEAAAEILEYLELVVDGCHQDKEERVVFPLLLDRTSADVRGTVERLLAEHERERRVLEQVRGNLEGAAYGDPLSRDSFVNLSSEYSTRLREHAQWEDECLLPIAEEYLGDWEDSQMLAAYRALEERYFAIPKKDPRKMLRRIRTRFGEVESQLPCLALPDFECSLR